MGVNYEKVADSESDDYRDCTLSEANESQTHLSRRARFDRASTGLTLLNIFLFIFSATLCGITYLHRPRTNSQALQEVLAYSPLLDHIEFQFENKQVEGSLFDEEFLSREELVLRGHSNNASDAAWAALTKIQRIPTTADEVRRLGKDPGSTVRIPAQYGFGDKTHIIQLDAQHNLHCLNTIRQYAYREYYFPEAVDTVHDGTSPLPEIHQAHLAHCLSVLRQTLTCNPSLEVLVHRWVQDQIYPFPDFDVNKKCIRHDQILDWQAKNAMPDEQWYEFTAEGPGEEATVFEPPPKLLKWTSEHNSGASAVEKS